MAISSTAHYEEEIGGEPRPLLLRNEEIERFEIQHAPLGIYELFDQLFGRGTPQVRHVRDLVALGLVGAGMKNRAADELIAAQGPDQNRHLREVAQRLLGVTFFPEVTQTKKPEAGSRKAKASQPKRTTTRAAGS